jgi:hypothetical protein
MTTKTIMTKVRKTMTKNLDDDDNDDVWCDVLVSKKQTTSKITTMTISTKKNDNDNFNKKE